MNWKAILAPTQTKLIAFFFVYFGFQVIAHITFLNFGNSLVGVENVNGASLILYYLTQPFTLIQAVLVTSWPELSQKIAFIAFPLINTLNVLWAYVISAIAVHQKWTAF